MHPQPKPASNPRRLLENALARVGLGAWRHPIVTILVVLASIAGLASRLPEIEFENDVDRYLEPSDPVRVAYDALRAQFGRDDVLYIAITPPKVFDAHFLETLRALHERLEDELPWVNEVRSLVNARQTRGVGDELIVDELMEEWPEGPEAIAAVERIASANPFYRNLFLSDDGRTTGIVVEPMTYQPGDVDGYADFDDEVTAKESEPTFIAGWQTAELVSQAHDFVASAGLGPDTKIHVMGTPVINVEIQEQTAGDMARFSALSLIAIALLLGVVFRRWVAIVLPLLLVALSVVAVAGAMVLVGRPLTFVSQIVPSFTLAVGVGFSVHVLAMFFQGIDGGVGPADALEYALRHSGPAIVMSSLTTAGGMASFIVSNLAPIRDIGIFVPFGVLVAAALSLVLLPACLALLPVRPRNRADDARTPTTERVLMACGRFGTRHPIPVLLASLTILAIAAAGIPSISQSYDPLKWLPEDNRARIASEYVDRALGGSAGMEIVFDAGRENGLHEPATLETIEAIQRYVERHPGDDFSIRKTTSVGDIAKEIHQALHAGNRDYYRIADDRRTLAQELFLFESSGSDDLEDVVDSQFRLARISLKGEHTEAVHYLEYLEKHDEKLRALAGEGELTMTGFFALAAHVAQLTVQTSIRSYVLAFLLITPLMMLFIGSLRTGIISMAPNLMPIAIVMGVMGWVGAPLDVFTVLIGGIALGLVVDDTIHILHGFRTHFLATGSVEIATAATMRTTGRALFFTTIVLTSAFSIYGFASATTVANFGLLSALAVFLAFGFDIFLSPALLALVYRGQERDPNA